MAAIPEITLGCQCAPKKFKFLYVIKTIQSGFNTIFGVSDLFDNDFEIKLYKD